MLTTVRRLTIPVCAVGVLFAATGCKVDTPGGGSTSFAPPPSISATTHWDMPNEVGVNLQQAQNDIQKLTGNLIFFTSSHDVSGQGRHQILDKDWKVCSQNIPVGSPITIGSKIDFGTVKLAESCP
ncbi:MAG TPA: hypothetical protein VGN81_20345 [Pseudonocardiaceae bacterium]